MAALNRENLIPICGDECVSGAAEILALGKGGTIAGANLKLIKAGGVTPVLRAASICEQLGLSVTLAGKVAGTSLSELGESVRWLLPISAEELGEIATLRWCTMISAR